jgi:hypothetical protein
MGRKPLGGTGDKTVMVPMRWASALLARVDAARGDTDRSVFIREAVTREVEQIEQRGTIREQSVNETLEGSDRTFAP